MVRYHQTDLVVKVTALDQVVVSTDLTERADREGRRLSRSSDSLLGILVFGKSVELTLGGDEIFVGPNLECEITEVTGCDVVFRTDESDLTMICFVFRFPLVAGGEPHRSSASLNAPHTQPVWETGCPGH